MGIIVNGLLNLAGSVRANGDVTATDDLIATDDISGNDVNATGNVGCVDVNATGDLGGGTATVTGKTTTAGLDSSGDITLTDPGTNANSKEILLVADNGGTPQTAAMQVMYGADPYIRVSAPNDSGTKTAVFDVHDTVVAFCTDNTVDIGAAGANRPKDIHASGKAVLAGDIEAAGGYQTLLGPFYESPCSANQTAIAISIPSITPTFLIMPKAGSIIGISAYVNDPRTAGTCTLEVLKNGVGIGLTCQINGTDTEKAVATQAKDADAFVAKDAIGVAVTTSADWAPATCELVCTVLVEM